MVGVTHPAPVRSIVRSAVDSAVRSALKEEL